MQAQTARAATQKSMRLPMLEKIWSNSTTCWKTVRIANWDGEGVRRVQITSNTAVWYHSGMPIIPVRWGLVRDPEGRFAPQASLATDHQLAPERILTYFIRHWQMEATFEEARTHRGVETQRPWSAKAMARTTPALLALYSIVTSLAAYVVGTNIMPGRTAAWCRKEHATFSDTVALGRRCLWSQCRFLTSGAEANVVKIPRSLFERFTDALCYAA
jgi:hypothetical protein